MARVAPPGAAGEALAAGPREGAEALGASGGVPPAKEGRRILAERAAGRPDGVIQP